MKYKFIFISILLAIAPLSLVDGYNQSDKLTQKSQIEKLINDGTHFFDSMEIDKAFQIFSKALNELEHINFPEAEVTVHFYLAKICNLKREFKDVEKHLNQCLMYLQILGDEEFESLIHNLLGKCYEALGYNNKAIKSYENSLRISNQITYTFGELASLQNLGDIYFKSGDYLNALEKFSKALELCQEVKDNDSHMMILFSLGMVYMFLNEQEKALDYLNQSNHLIKNSTEYSKQKFYLMNLEQIYHLKGNFQKALEYAEEELKLISEKGDITEEAFCRARIAISLEKMGQYKRAMQYYNQALSISREINNIGLECHVLTSMTFVYGYMDEWLEAKNLIDTALKLPKMFLDEFSLSLIYLLAGRVYAHNAEYEKSISFYKNAISIFESTRQKISLENYRIKYADLKTQFYYDEIISLLYKLHSRNTNMTYDEDAFLYVEKAKARTLIEILSEKKQGIKIGLSNKDIEYENFLYEKIESLRSSLLQVRNADDYTNLLNELRRIEKELEIHKIEIQKKNPKYASIQYPKPLTVKKVQEEVINSKDTAMLEYYIGEEQSYLFVISKENFILLKLNTNKNELMQKLKNLRKPLTEVDASITGLYLFDFDIAHSLYKELISPALPYLFNVKDLIIVPHGCIYYLPFEMLVSEISNDELISDDIFGEYKRFSYLIENFSVKYISAASVLDPVLYPDKSTQYIDEDGIFVMANPDFNSNSISKIALPGDELTFPIQMRNNINKLVFSGREADEIIKYFDNSILFKEEMASEENFRKYASKYPLIHISTHGFFNDIHPMYSSLVFSYNNDIAEVDILHAYEIYNFDLSAKLITLSACETALGQDIETLGGEGIVGLSRAFLCAGARSLIISLWKVDDEATSILMSEFYRNLKVKGLEKTEALRQAKLYVMKKNKRIGNKYLSYSHPFFWAPFILIGE